MNYKILLVLKLLTDFTECHQYWQVIRVCLFASPLVPSVNSYYYHRIARLVPLKDATDSRSFIRYCDMDEPIYCQDPFMNRVVALVAHTRDVPQDSTRFGNGEVVTTGVFLNDYMVLSSFNPFRKLRTYLPRRFMSVYFYRAKWYVGNKFHGYVIEPQNISCIRQVAGDVDFTLPPEQYHGADRQHSPVHDLVVFRTAKYIGSRLWHEPWYTTWKGHANENFTNLGPEVTVLAEPGQHLSDKLKFVSLGFIDDDHIANSNHLLTVELDREDRVVVNCDEWFIRDWGYFICIRNIGNYVGIASGAFLFSNNKLFGVGSFALKKDNDSILAFTDVRPYHSEIRRTCN